jgi:cysteine synthase
MRPRYVFPAAALAGGTAVIAVAKSSVACKTGCNVTTTNVAEGQFDVVIVGGGCGGSAVGSQLLAKDPKLKIAFIEPSETHYCEPNIPSHPRLARPTQLRDLSASPCPVLIRAGPMPLEY